MLCCVFSDHVYYVCARIPSGLFKLVWKIYVCFNIFWKNPSLPQGPHNKSFEHMCCSSNYVEKPGSIVWDVNHPFCFSIISEFGRNASLQPCVLPPACPYQAYRSDPYQQGMLADRRLQMSGIRSWNLSQYSGHYLLDGNVVCGVPPVANINRHAQWLLLGTWNTHPLYNKQHQFREGGTGRGGQLNLQFVRVFELASYVEQQQRNTHRTC